MGGERPRGGNGDEKPTLRARQTVGSAIIIVVLVIVLGQAFGPAFGYNIQFPPTAYPLLAAALAFWLGIRLSDLGGGRKE